jgi:hypothetical protein
VTVPPPPMHRQDERTTTAVVILTWLATRVLAVVSVDMTPWMLHDIEIYGDWAPILSTGAFPADDPTWQYPPGIAPLFVAAGALAIDFRWAFTLAVLLVDAALLAVLLTARRRHPDASWRGPWLWALAGLIIGPIMMVRFDVVPTLFAVLAVVLVARPTWSGAAAAAGALTKVWPALMLLILPRRALPRGLAGFAAVVVAGLLVASVTMTDSLAFLSNQQSRGLQVESLGAWPYELWSVLGGTVDFGLEYGSIQVRMAGTEGVGLAIMAVGLVILGVLGWARLAGRLEKVPPGDVALTVVLVSLVTSRVNSPQFTVWLIGLSAAALLDRRSRMRTAVGLVVLAAILTQLVYPWSATQLVTGSAFIVGVQGVRLLLLLVATVMGLHAVLWRRERERGAW